MRTRGGARADTAYDLVNGYCTDQETVVVRPGSINKATLPSTTKGLTFFDELLHVFSHQVETVPVGYVNHVITNPVDNTQLIRTIHFAEPFLGFLYVVAEFEDDSVYHYWLASVGTWEANHVYKAGDAVTATADTGLIYKATRAGPPNPSWAPGITRTVGEIVEPTVYNDFFYTVVDTEGSARSGTTEPIWPTEDGAQITEESDTDTPTSQSVTFPPANSVPSDVSDRYGPRAPR